MRVEIVGIKEDLDSLEQLLSEVSFRGSNLFLDIPQEWVDNPDLIDSLHINPDEIDLFATMRHAPYDFVGKRVGEGIWFSVKKDTAFTLKHWHYTIKYIDFLNSILGDAERKEFYVKLIEHASRQSDVQIIGASFGYAHDVFSEEPYSKLTADRDVYRQTARIAECEALTELILDEGAAKNVLVMSNLHSGMMASFLKSHARLFLRSFGSTAFSTVERARNDYLSSVRAGILEVLKGSDETQKIPCTTVLNELAEAYMSGDGEKIQEVYDRLLRRDPEYFSRVIDPVMAEHIVSIYGSLRENDDGDTNTDGNLVQLFKF